MVVSDNIFLVVVDTLSAFHLPCYGYDKDTAPFISRLAEQNMKIEFGYSNSPWTVPSHASLFSGELPYHHGTTSQNMRFDSRSFVQDLKEEKYRTIGISNNALVSNNLGFDRGFDEFYDDKEEIYFKSEGLDALATVLEKERRHAYDYKLYKYLDLLKESIYHRDFRSILEGGRYLLEDSVMRDSGAEATNNFLIQKVKYSSSGRNFYFVNYMEPHQPYLPPAEFASEFLDSPEEAKKVYKEEIHGEGRDDKRSEMRDEIIGLYDAEVRYLDSKLKELYMFLESELDDFVMIFVGDHGENLGEYGNEWGHQKGIWEKLVRVPIIIAGPEIESRDIESNISLRNIGDFIRGSDVEEITSEKVFAEYYGWRGFLEYADENIENKNISRKEADNQSKCMIRGQDGFIKNTELEASGFRAEKDKRGRGNLSKDIREKLEQQIEKKFDFDIMGIDI
ncbi:MAG: sulfatase-like hydrolase/transferase [Candidatus Nanohaloarchaea archaeon]